MKMSLGEIANAVGAVLLDEDDRSLEICAIGIDSRDLAPQSLFVPLIGARDGHEFVASAQENGAVAAFWQLGHSGKPEHFPLLEVENPLAAMQALAKYYLIKVNPKVVAITGSNGKTTTKDMTAALLTAHYHTCKTQANFNNEIGVPLTILSMNTNTEVLVVEMGMDRPGQLSFLSNLVEPDVAVITMIGEAHIEFFGTRAKIADAKMEITAGLKEDGTLIIQGDEPLLRERTAHLVQSLVTIGQQATNDFYPDSIATAPNCTAFTVNRWPDLKFTLPMMGAYNVNNALAALAVGRLFHLQPRDMITALKSFIPTANRTEWLQATNGAAILSDVYNSNPTAAHEVLTAFAQVPSEGRRIAVLGDMLELGVNELALHAQLASALNPDHIQVVYLYGDLMAELKQALLAKYPLTNLHSYSKAQQAELIAALREDVQPQDSVLLKASHGLHLERVVAALTTSVN